MKQDFIDLELKNSKTLEGVVFNSPGELTLADLGMNLTVSPTIEISHWELAHCIAIEHWLTEYQPKYGASSLEQVRGYLETLHHLCQLQEIKQIRLILSIPVRINPPNIKLAIPFYEYLLYQGLSRELLEISQDILTSIPSIANDLDDIIMLKGRALSAISDRTQSACSLFKNLILQSLPNSYTHIEATARLGMNQVSLGLYQEGIENLENSLKLITDFFNNQQLTTLDLKIQDLGTDVRETLALYALNNNNFDRAIELYKQVIVSREKQGLTHKLITPLGHLGVIYRRLAEYQQSIEYLEAAKIKSQEINHPNASTWIEHHLGYTLLNQGNIVNAEELCQKSLAGYIKLQDKRGIADCYEQLGLICLSQQKIKQAEEKFQEALKLRQSVGNLHGTASSLNKLAFIFWHKRQYLKFIIFALRSVNFYIKLGILNSVRFKRMMKLVYVWTIGKRNWTT
ncbi:MAG: tetratricopeptide repeat protein [Crinalium sp.]